MNLFGEPGPQAPAYVVGAVVTIPTALLVEHNYRETYDENHIRRLSIDIAKVGLQTPPKARPMADGTWRLIYGHCRTRAVRMLNWETMPVVVADAEQSAVDEFLEQLRENELRLGVSKADKARAALRARDEFSLPLETISQDMNVSTGTLRNWLRCAESLSMAALDDWSNAVITDTQAYALCRVDKDRQSPILALCRSEKFSTKGFESLIEKVVTAQNEDRASGLFDVDSFALQLQDMGADAKLAAAQAKAAKRADAESALEQSAEIEELRRMLWQAQRALKRADPSLAKAVAKKLGKVA